MIWSGVELRGADAMGDGAFASSRGYKRHKGTDYKFEPGAAVHSPMGGIVTRLGLCYPNADYQLVEIQNDAVLLRLLYVDPIVTPGEDVIAGQTIGTAQKISDRYGEGMTDHVHVEMNVDVSRIFGGIDGDSNS